MKLHSLAHSEAVNCVLIGPIATRPLGRAEDRPDTILLWHEPSPPRDSVGYCAIVTPLQSPDWSVDSPLAHGLKGLDYLSDGDVIRIEPSGFVRTLYRRDSRHNFIFVTDQCNSYCLMCSQPPLEVDDFCRISEHIRLIGLIDPATRELGITGGEPTLFGKGFLRLIQHCKAKLADTSLHVLTNGRLFCDREFAKKSR